MNEFHTLLEKNWICKDTDKELYYKIKKDIPLFQSFIHEQLGWRLIHTEHILKLEKVPSHAESFMGIQEFTEIRDYCILCVILMYLEDKEEQEQFLLSELIDFVETKLKSNMEVDWTSFAQRKSLVRVLQYMERLDMLRVYEGSSESFSQKTSQEVLYENTGYSKYFATTFSFDISGFTSAEDFEKVYMDQLESNRGHIRVNRVYRQMVSSPAIYWDSIDDADALYLKTQKQSIARNLETHLGGRLDIDRNMACWMSEDGSFGLVHPRDAMLPEVVLLVCGEIQQEYQNHILNKKENECIYITKEKLSEIIWKCRNQWYYAWSKEYREMDQIRLVKMIIAYMSDWMMIKECGTEMCILPSSAKMAGKYPADFKGGAHV